MEDASAILDFMDYHVKSLFLVIKIAISNLLLDILSRGICRNGRCSCLETHFGPGCEFKKVTNNFLSPENKNS